LKRHAPKFYKQDALGFLKIRIEERERELKLLKHRAKVNSFMTSPIDKHRLKMKIQNLEEDVKELKRDYATSTGKSK